MGKWWHTFATIGMIALGAFTPYLQAAIGAHPLISVILGGAWSIIGHLLPSPVLAKQ
jgi:hypothetical protein